MRTDYPTILNAIARESLHWFDCYTIALDMFPTPMRLWERRIYACKMDNAQSRFVVVLNRYSEQLRMEGRKPQEVCTLIADAIINSGMA